MAITDFESTIKTYIEKVIQESYPELSCGEGSPVSDLFTNPMVALMKPILSTISRTDYMQDLTNADTMTEDELDSIGVNNYGVTRSTGNRASGFLYVEVNPEFVGPLPFIIGPLVAATSDGLQFASSDSTIIKINSTDVVDEDGTTVPGVAADYLNINTGKYEFPIYILAAEAGSAYNVAVGEISTLVSRYPLLTGIVSNKDEFADGTDTESNADYLDNIKDSQMYKAYGTHTGYKSYVLKNFPTVQNVYVAGFGDDPMLRDKIIYKTGGRMLQDSIGGKVDIYIRGAQTGTFSQTIYYASNKLRLYNPLLVTEDAIIVDNITNPGNNDLDCTLVYENPDTKTGWVEATVIPGPSGIAPAVGDEIQLSYISYINETITDTYKYEESIFYNSPAAKVFMVPYEGAVGLVNNTTGATIPVAGAFTTSTLYPILETSMCPDQTGVAPNAIKLNPDLGVYIPNYYAGKTIFIYSGTGAGQTKTGVTYNADTKIVTCDSAWTTPPNSTSKYIIRDNVNLYANSARDPVVVNFTPNLQVGTPAVNAYNPGDILTLSYTYDVLVNDVQYDMDVLENRNITTDVLARQASPSYIYIGFTVQCTRGNTIGSAEKTLFSGLIQNILSDTDFDSSLQMTDIISQLNNNDQVASIVDYFIVPPVFFKASAANMYTESQVLAMTDSAHCLSEISFSNQEYPVLAVLGIQKVN